MEFISRTLNSISYPNIQWTQESRPSLLASIYSNRNSDKTNNSLLLSINQKKKYICNEIVTRTTHKISTKKSVNYIGNISKSIRFYMSSKVSFVEDSENNNKNIHYSNGDNQVISRYDSKRMTSTNFILFDEIRKIMENNPINHDTQLKIEEFVYNYSLNSNKSMNIYEAIGKLN